MRIGLLRKARVFKKFGALWLFTAIRLIAKWWVPGLLVMLFGLSYLFQYDYDMFDEYFIQIDERTSIGQIVIVGLACEAFCNGNKCFWHYACLCGLFFYCQINVWFEGNYLDHYYLVCQRGVILMFLFSALIIGWIEKKFNLHVTQDD